MKAAKARGEVDYPCRVIVERRGGAARNNLTAGKNGVLEPKNRRVDGEQITNRIGSGERHQFASVILVTDSYFAGATAEVHPAFIDLIVSAGTAVH